MGGGGHDVEAVTETGLSFEIKTAGYHIKQRIRLPERGCRHCAGPNSLLLVSPLILGANIVIHLETSQYFRGAERMISSRMLEGGYRWQCIWGLAGISTRL